jgi:ComF family protein
MWTIWDDFLSLFFPRLCVACKAPLVKGEEHICLKCLCDLPHADLFMSTDNPVAKLFAGMCVDYATAFLHFEKKNKVQRLIHSLKYYGNKQLAYTLGRHAAMALQSHPVCQSLDFLIPVPLHPKRKRARGYNQSEWICRGLSSILHVEVHTTALQRQIKTNTQTKKTIYERRTSMQDVFAPADVENLRGRRVLLVDDVVTSGSTLSACAEVLLSVPDVHVNILALAAV